MILNKNERGGIVIQIYRFGGEDPLEFDDAKTVKELIQYAFERFGYYEPLGMDIVTIFQVHHPDSNTGWFTIDVDKCCANEIINRNELCFAYYMPNVFYFAEGGWGHHMLELGNHPTIPNQIALKIELNGERNTIAINGNITCRSIINKLIDVGYIESSITKINILEIAYPQNSNFREILLSDAILDIPLTEFVKTLSADAISIVVLN